MTAWVIKMFKEYYAGTFNNEHGRKDWGKLNTANLFATKKDVLITSSVFDSNEAVIVKVDVKLK